MADRFISTMLIFVILGPLVWGMPMAIWLLSYLSGPGSFPAFATLCGFAAFIAYNVVGIAAAVAGAVVFFIDRAWPLHRARVLVAVIIGAASAFPGVWMRSLISHPELVELVDGRSRGLLLYLVVSGSVASLVCAIATRQFGFLAVPYQGSR